MTKILDLLTNKLKSPLSRPLRGVESFTSGNENARVAHFQKLYDFYVGDQASIKRYTERAMGVVFEPDSLDKMLLPYFNLTRRIINRLAVAYKIPPERYIIVPSTEEGETVVLDTLMQQAHENYQKLLKNSNINSQAKLWHRFAKLLDTVYIKPTYRKDHIEFDVFCPHQLKVQERDENILLPKRIQYDIASPEGEKTVIWTDEEHWVETDGVRLAKDNEWNGVNKYGVLPFIPLRLREVENHWGEGDSQLVDINEKINVLLASCYFNAIMQSHGQPFGINLNLDGKLKTGPNWVIEAKNVTKDDVIPDFRFVSPNPSIDSNTKLIDFLVKQAAVTRGLPPSSVSLDVNPQSGASKAIDNWELLENREDDIEFLRPFEKGLFEITRTVWNYHSVSQDRINEKAEFGIDFIIPKVPMTEVEEVAVKDWKYKYGLWTPVDDMVDEDEGVNRKLAMQYIMEKLDEKEKIDEVRMPSLIQVSSAVNMGDNNGMNGQNQMDAQNAKQNSDPTA